ncbi:MAG: DUF4358 domain-containing protein [Oscillospiraceae bacterium]|nr:DUF4358 domain-containing protein [Oscillospiraceae bacterium]
MKEKLLKIAALALALILVFCSCSRIDPEDEETNPEEFSWEMLDISLVVDGIYAKIDISRLTSSSVSIIDDKTTLTEQYYLNLDNIITYEVRSADGKYGVADVIIIRPKEGFANEVMDALEMRKDDRINEFLNYDVYDSYAIALEAEIYQAGELIVMLMLSDENKAVAKELIDYYLP